MTPKKLLFFTATGIIGGLVIGISVGTNLSPVLLGITGAIIIFAVAVILDSLWGKYWIDE